MEKTRYTRVRILANFISIIGWIYIVLGAVGFILAFFDDMLSHNFLPTMSGIILGVLALAGAQLINAVADMAVNSQEILAELRKRSNS